MKKVLVVGATSAIAEAAARILARRGARLYLVARDADKARALADDLRLRGCPLAGFEAMDCDDFAAHAPMLDRAETALGGLDGAIVAHGVLPDQAACQKSAALALASMRTNALSVVSLLTELADRFEKRRAGTIVVLSSVAGDRGRASNYVYGSAKALVSTFLSGLRQSLRRSGVAVVTVKPGFVDTPMTRAFKKGPLWASPERVARILVAAADAGSGVVYAPGFWRLIMGAIKAVPESLFVRLTL